LYSNSSKYRQINSDKLLIANKPWLFEGTKGAMLTKKQTESPTGPDSSGCSGGAGESQFKMPASRHPPVSERPRGGTGGLSLQEKYRAFEWEQSEKQADLCWYEQDESGYINDDREESYFIMGGRRGFEAEEALGGKKIGSSNLKQNEKNLDHLKWEINRMDHSGFFIVKNQQSMAEDDDLNRVTLMVHDVKPPFLDDKIKYTKQLEPIQIVKDAESDMAILSKKGSMTIKKQRELKDMQKQRDKLLSLEGTRLGQILNVEKKVSAEDEEFQEICLDQEGEANYRTKSQYGTRMLKKTEAVSQFAKTKTIKE